MTTFENTRAAVARAREHVRAAELLADGKLFGQAYAHASLALEESSVAGIQMLVESGAIDWENPPSWLKIRKRDLYRPGTHLQKFGIGLTIAVVHSRIAGRPLSDEPLTRDSVMRMARERSAELSEAVTLLRSPETLRILGKGVARRNAAFYSTAKGAQVEEPPGEVEYQALMRIVGPVVRSYDQPWPEEHELAQLRVLLVAVCDLAAGDPERMRELFGLPPSTTQRAQPSAGPAGPG